MDEILAGISLIVVIGIATFILVLKQRNKRLIREWRVFETANYWYFMRPVLYDNPEAWDKWADMVVGALTGFASRWEEYHTYIRMQTPLREYYRTALVQRRYEFQEKVTKDDDLYLFEDNQDSLIWKEIWATSGLIASAKLFIITNKKLEKSRESLDEYFALAQGEQLERKPINSQVVMTDHPELLFFGYSSDENMVIPVIKLDRENIYSILSDISNKHSLEFVYIRRSEMTSRDF